jgi:hypothetical protein
VRHVHLDRDVEVTRVATRMLVVHVEVLDAMSVFDQSLITR